jgi:hypothetical protein
MANCDFCFAVNDSGARRYKPSANVAFCAAGSPLWLEQGDWCACVVCAELIETQNWKSLMERAMTLNPSVQDAELLGLSSVLRKFLADAWSAVFNQSPEVFL